MRVLVTRPAAQADEWVGLLCRAGLDAHALPLIAITPAPEPQLLANAWSRLSTFALVMFVSPNAAAAFFAARPEGAVWPETLCAGSPGPGTTRVLRALGVSQVIEPAADAAQFDSESLWQNLSDRPWAGQQVLIVRGESGRDWLATQLRSRGAEIDFVAAYGRAAPVLSVAHRSLLDAALARPSDHLWLFSSSEAIGHLRGLAPGADWSRSRALATHPRIAESARRLGLGQVLEARPSTEAVIACIQSISS